MRFYYPGRNALPVMLLLIACVTVMGQLDLLQISRLAHFWPVTLIASGVEELYLWSITSGRS